MKTNHRKLKTPIPLLLQFSPSCSQEPAILGSIIFTSEHDCDIRLFHSNGAQIDRVMYEVGKPPVVVQMKSSGVFIVHATRVGAGHALPEKTIKEPITYIRGTLEYFIAF